MQKKSLLKVIEERPFPEYGEWWPMGEHFCGFMSQAISSEWMSLPINDGEMAPVKQYAATYLERVYGRSAATSLVDDFVSRTISLQSGEFDALSYAFYRSAFELIGRSCSNSAVELRKARRKFTIDVGKAFFFLLRDHLRLQLPGNLSDPQSFSQFRDCIDEVGHFLLAEGYLRDHFSFSFSVEAINDGKRFTQAESDFLADLEQNGIAFAQYEMGFPVILPSAVYLYHTIGEAQHHSSRTIEELFASAGCEARETDDFDPIRHPSSNVVEFWTVRKQS